MLQEQEKIKLEHSWNIFKIYNQYCILTVKMWKEPEEFYKQKLL